MTLIHCQGVATLCATALLFAASPTWADDAALAANAASASKGPPAGVNLQRSCAPSYPAAALQARASGTTRVRLTIEPTGAISSAEVVQSSGPLPENKLLDTAAADALSKCQSRAGRDANGQPVGAQVVVTYKWTLE